MKKRKLIVYSTNPDYNYGNDTPEEPQTLPPGEQNLRVWLESKGRAGKAMTIVRGFVGTTDDLKAMAKDLKALCGVGGTAKDGELALQGDQRDKTMEYLTKKGYAAKKAGS